MEISSRMSSEVSICTRCTNIFQSEMSSKSYRYKTCSSCRHGSGKCPHNEKKQDVENVETKDEEDLVFANMIVADLLAKNAGRNSLEVGNFVLTIVKNLSVRIVTAQISAHIPDENPSVLIVEELVSASIIG